MRACVQRSNCGGGAELLKNTGEPGGQDAQGGMRIYPCGGNPAEHVQTRYTFTMDFKDTLRFGELDIAGEMSSGTVATAANS